jgi:hypothetical protein
MLRAHTMGEKASPPPRINKALRAADNNRMNANADEERCSSMCSEFNELSACLSENERWMVLYGSYAIEFSPRARG